MTWGTVCSNGLMNTVWALPTDEDRARFWTDPCNTLDPVVMGVFEEGTPCGLALDLTSPGLALVAYVETFDRQTRNRFAARYSTNADGVIIPNVALCMIAGGEGHLPDDLVNPLRNHVKHTLRVESLATIHRQRKMIA